ncbi:MAG: excinuclease ABC subunit UvrB [DPANN group archaeon]|nr:excinuclease ABC subunit UvrB [DPANN group archaeon]
MDKFNLVSKFEPKGDQINAIKQLTEGLKKNHRYQTLKGVTGSGKTFTIANVINNVNRPTLIITHNKTLAAQLYNEFKEFFPENAVEYFVSYYDYYQPESYIPQKDLYIAKDASINDKIDKLRLSATRSLMTRHDVIIVASVSCIYGLGSPEEYKKMIVSVKVGDTIDMDQLIEGLCNIQYTRNDTALERTKFRIKGDIVDIYLSYDDIIVRIDFFGDTIEKISILNPITQQVIRTENEIVIFPAKHFVMPEERTLKAIKTIKKELEERLKVLYGNGEIVEAKRLDQRTNYDLEMLKEIGYCSGIENYSRHFDNRKPGSPPSTLIDFFPEDFMIVIDESHATMPQIRGMFFGDHSRKKNLIDYGFRLPSAFDNRPLQFDEFNKFNKNTIFLSATPADYEKDISKKIVEQIIRPTGLVDPEIFIRSAKDQVQDVKKEILNEIKKGFRVLITTLTKKQSEDLSEHLESEGIKTQYLHSEINTIERTEIIRNLRLGKFDCLVGVNLLREGLDIPEVSLVAILDADKEGFLRSKTSLIQTMGRASRNSESRVILYADKITDSIKAAKDETEKRRKIQIKYNQKHNIEPKTIIRDVQKKIVEDDIKTEIDISKIPASEIEFMIYELELEMDNAAENLEFEKAAELRDTLKKLKERLD